MEMRINSSDELLLYVQESLPTRRIRKRSKQNSEEIALTLNVCWKMNEDCGRASHKEREREREAN